MIFFPFFLNEGKQTSYRESVASAFRGEVLACLTNAFGLVFSLFMFFLLFTETKMPLQWEKEDLSL
jgi:hypothetical protein